MAIRVHLADDHTMFREGLEAILASHDGIEVVGRSSTGGEDAIVLIEGDKPDVVITQIDTDLAKAREVLSRVRRASPDSRIVVLTMFDNLHYVQALSRLGIDACIHKTSSSEELIATVEALGRDPDGKNVVVSMPRGSLEKIGEAPMEALSERETEVLVHVSRGLSNSQVAEELDISEATVKRHLANVYQKMGVRSRSGATREALSQHWIGLGEITSAASADGSSRDGSSGNSRRG